MKRYLFILIFLFSIACTNAQKNFEGEITYLLHASNESKPDAELKVLFGVNKIKLRFKEKEDYDKEYLLVLFDSASLFVINAETKTYSKTPLLINAPVKQLQKRSFAGYPASPVAQESNALASLMGGMAGRSSTVFYLADSLYYNIPTIFSNNKELIIVQKNKIVLGAEISIDAGDKVMDDETDKKATLINVEAISIKPMVSNEDEFKIPAEYVDYRTAVLAADSITTTADTTLFAVDSAVVAPPAKQKINKQPVKSNKSKTPVKSSAAKRKD